MERIAYKIKLFIAFSAICLINVLYGDTAYANQSGDGNQYVLDVSPIIDNYVKNQYEEMVKGLNEIDYENLQENIVFYEAGDRIEAQTEKAQ